MAIAHFTLKAFSRYLGDTGELFPDIVDIHAKDGISLGIRTRKDQVYHWFDGNSFENYIYGALDADDNYMFNPGWYGVGYVQAFYPYNSVIVGFDVKPDNTATFAEMLTCLKEHFGGLGFEQEFNKIV